MAKALWLAGAAVLATPAAAEVTLDPLFRGHAVIQRDTPIRVTGSALPGEAVTVSLAGARATARADRDGRFAVDLPARPAGGPYRLAADAPSGSDAGEDVMLGDVFLCSGQSNMEMAVGYAQDAWSQVAMANDGDLRLFTVPRATGATPRADLPAATTGWAATTPDSVRGFSAACYYMAKELRRTAGVAIGAIHASWGGSRISSWMTDAGLKATGAGDAVALRLLYGRDRAAAGKQAGAAWERWWRAATGDAAGREPWSPDATLGWRPVPRIALWEDWGVPELADYNGMVWFRNEVTLTPAQAKQAATLSIGPVDDTDQTWVNGRFVGSGGNPGAPRHYPVAAGTLVAGRNVVTVNANDVYAKGGMPGPAEAMALVLADGTRLPLGTGWSYAIERRRPGEAPRAPWDDTAGSGNIYNGMIAPLGRIGLKGVAWYQGESDTGLPGYADRMAALMAGWRAQFGIPDLPFAIVQLAGYGTPATAPAESGWANVREAQRRAAAADGHAAIAPAIDLGDPLDIHPGEKREVGRRLARALRVTAYGAAEPASGPLATAATRTGDGGVRVTFTGVTGALATRGGDRALSFELCGAEEGSCRYASATAAGDGVTIAGDGRAATRVRYAWADVPTINLFDGAGLPVVPFELAVK